MTIVRDRVARCQGCPELHILHGAHFCGNPTPNGRLDLAAIRFWLERDQPDRCPLGKWKATPTDLGRAALDQSAAANHPILRDRQNQIDRQLEFDHHLTPAELATGAAKAARALVRNLPPNRISRRLSICKACAFWHRPRCRLCGCFTALKARRAEYRCPLGLWESNITPDEAAILTRLMRLGAIDAGMALRARSQPRRPATASSGSDRHR